jgi:hypothetical protein
MDLEQVLLRDKIGSFIIMTANIVCRDYGMRDIRAKN